MRSFFSVLGLCATLLLAVPAATAGPMQPVETARLGYDFGRCDAVALYLPSDVPVRLEVTVRHQFDPEARIRIPQFLWMRDLPLTIAPETLSVTFEAIAGEYRFDVVTGEDARTLCEGMLFVR